VHSKLVVVSTAVSEERVRFPGAVMKSFPVVPKQAHEVSEDVALGLVGVVVVFAQSGSDDRDFGI